jgi:hypothetical protein
MNITTIAATKSQITAVEGTEVVTPGGPPAAAETDSPANAAFSQPPMQAAATPQSSHRLMERKEIMIAPLIQ